MISRLDKSKSTILISLGSTGNWEKLKLLCSEKFYVFNILTAGDQSRILSGPHIIARDFINTTALLPHIDLVMCHGGNGTIYQALSGGISILGLTNMFEQEWNMQRIQELELGETIGNLKDGDAGAFYETVMRWINKKPLSSLSSKIGAFDSSRRKEIFLKAVASMQQG